jgi:3-oxoacyl-[acyl-carrier protein] reductase
MRADEVVEKLKKMAPLERLGQPEDVAEVVAFLVNEEGSWANAQVMRANGGIF